MSQAADYNLGRYDRADDGRVFAIGFACAVGVHLVFGLVLFAPFMEGFREWLFTRGQAEQVTEVTADGKPRDPEKVKPEAEKDKVDVRENLRRTLMAPPPKLKPAEQSQDVPLGQDKGSDTPTMAWISYDAFEEMVARQGKVLQPGQQSMVTPVSGAEMIANPTLGEGQPQPEGGAGMGAANPVPQMPAAMRPAAPAQPPSPEGRTLVPTPAPESPSMAAMKPAENLVQKATVVPEKAAEPVPVKTPPTEVPQAPEKTAQAPSKPVEKPTEADPTKAAGQAPVASLGNKGEQPEASKDASRDVDAKIAVKPEASPKPQAGPGEQGVAKDLSAGKTSERVSLDKGPGIGPDQTASLEPGKAKVDGMANTPEAGHVEGAPRPATDPAHSTGKTGSETKEQAREATQGVKEAKGEDQPTTKPMDQARPVETASAVAPDTVAMARVPEAVPTPVAPQNNTPSPAPAQGQAQAQPSQPSQGANQPSSTPGAAGPQGQPNSKEKPRQTSAPKSDRDSAPVSLTGDSTLPIRPGRVITGKGIEIKTFHPDFSVVAMITSVPSNPVCRVVFNKDGIVDSAEILRTSGYPNIDGPILSSLYRWEATGEELKKMNRAFSLTIEVILGNNNEQ